MKPYYDHAGITIYHGDCREILPQLSWFPISDCLITDPIWPHCEHIFPGVDAHGLLASALEAAHATRVVIHMGNNSDPRFLSAVPSRWPFLRVCYLAYVAVGYIGRLLREAEIAYVFGAPPPSMPGARVLPGRAIAIDDLGKTIQCDELAVRSNGDKKWGKSRNHATADHLDHPTMRNLTHVLWLIKWFGGERIIDPFAGAGTTLMAAAQMNREAIGIEIEEKYCEIAARRLTEQITALT